METLVPIRHQLVPVPTCSEIQWSCGTGTTLPGNGTQVLLEYQWSFGTSATLIGIGTTLTSTGTNMLFLQDLRGIMILVQGHARLLTPTLSSLMWIVFKPT